MVRPGEDGEPSEETDDEGDLVDDGFDARQHVSDIDDGYGGIGLEECPLHGGDLLGDRCARRRTRWRTSPLSWPEGRTKDARAEVLAVGADRWRPR